MHVPRTPATANRAAPRIDSSAEGRTVGAADRGTGLGETRTAIDATTASTTSETLVAADIEGIVVSSEVDLVGHAERFDATLLLKDGRAHLALKGSPAAIRPPLADAPPEGFWTRWRHAEGTGVYEVLDVVTDVWRALDGQLFAPRTESATASLAGGHERMRTTTLGATTSTVTERLELALDGTFSRARSVLATTVRPGLGTGAPGVLRVPETADDLSRLGGTWTLLEDGFTLELIDGEGRRETSLLLDGGGSRIVGGRRFSYTDERVDTIDFDALARRWTTQRTETGGWRYVLAEAMSRGAERRASGDGDRSPDRAPPPRPDGLASSPDRSGRGESGI